MKKSLLDQLEKSVSERLSVEEISKEASGFYAAGETAAKTMFGYPSHYVPLSELTQYLLLMHYNSPFANNCGDIDERGNYSMDSKAVEKRILTLFAEKLGIGDEFWGYVTSGGTESNACGVALAFNRYPGGVLYYSTSAHYSVDKCTNNVRRERIPSLLYDETDFDAFTAAIKKNYDLTGAPANVILTHGTTVYGACEPIDKTVSFLVNNRIPHFIHVDAALYGGIPNNQKDAPVLTDLKARGVDSVCVSLHKYIGFPDVKSVFLSTESPKFKTVQYIGQHDTTVSGSRSIPAYALLNHVKEQLSVRDENLYRKNVVEFERLLNLYGVKFYRADKANIFVIDKPCDEVCKKYQLSCFKEVCDGKVTDKAHVIIFSHHSLSAMESLAKDLRQ